MNQIMFSNSMEEHVFYLKDYALWLEDYKKERGTVSVEMYEQLLQLYMDLSQCFSEYIESEVTNK